MASIAMERMNGLETSQTKREVQTSCGCKKNVNGALKASCNFKSSWMIEERNEMIRQT